MDVDDFPRRRKTFQFRLSERGKTFLVVDYINNFSSWLIDKRSRRAPIFSPHPSNPFILFCSALSVLIILCSTFYTIYTTHFIFATKLLKNMTCWVLKIARNVYTNHKGVIRLRLEFFQLSKSLGCLMCFNYNVMGVVGLRWLKGST